MDKPVTIPAEESTKKPATDERGRLVRLLAARAHNPRSDVLKRVVWQGTPDQAASRIPVAAFQSAV